MRTTTSAKQATTGLIPGTRAGPLSLLRETDEGQAIPNLSDASLLAAMALGQRETLVDAYSRLLRLWLRPPIVRSESDPTGGPGQLTAVVART
jgi:hypothetical protein